MNLLVGPLGVSAGVAFLALLGMWAVSRGRVHRTDRMGAAALAIGFVGVARPHLGDGWSTGDPADALPLVAVVGALLAPRVAARLAPAGAVPFVARAFVLVAGGGAALSLALAGRADAAAIATGAVGATLGVALGERLPAGADAEAPPEPPPADGPRPDRRVGTWIVAALLVGLVPALAR